MAISLVELERPVLEEDEGFEAPRDTIFEKTVLPFLTGSDITHQLKLHDLAPPKSWEDTVALPKGGLLKFLDLRILASRGWQLGILQGHGRTELVLVKPTRERSRPDTEES